MLDIQVVALEENKRVVMDLLNLARAVANDSGEIKQAELAIAEAAVEMVIPITPIITGSLRSAHAVYVETEATFVRLAQEAINPISPERPAEYGPKVHEMGGLSRSGHERAFYDVLVRDFSEDLLDIGEDAFLYQLEVFR